MYKHVREVITGVIMSIVVMVASAVLASIDPWANGVPWVNWLVISLMTVFAVVVSVVIAANTQKEDDYWGVHLLLLLLFAFFGAMFAGVATTGGRTSTRLTTLWYGVLTGRPWGCS